MTEATHSWRPIDLLALGDTPPERPSVGGLLYRGARHVFSGEPESGKTFAAFALGLEAIRRGGRILHLDFEMYAARTRERLREMGASDDELACWVHVEPDAPPRDGDLESLLALEPTFAIIDAAAGAYDMAGLDDNARKDVERFARMIVRPLSRAGVGTVVVDHVTKSKETRGRFAIGSERKVGGVDVHLSFEAVKPLHRGATGLVKVTTAKDRDGYLPRPHAAEIEFVSDPETNAITWTIRPAAQRDEQAEATTFRPTTLMERVSRYLELRAEPASRAAVEDAVHGKRDYVRLALDVLTRERYIRETPGTRGARLVETVKPYRETADLAPTSPRPDEHDLAPTSPRQEPLNHAAITTSPHLAPTSPPTSPNDLAPVLTPPTGGRNRRGEVDQDEIERIATLATEWSSPSVPVEPSSRAHARAQSPPAAPDDDSIEAHELPAPLAALNPTTRQHARWLTAWQESPERVLACYTAATQPGVDNPPAYLDQLISNGDHPSVGDVHAAPLESAVRDELTRLSRSRKTSGTLDTAAALELWRTERARRYPEPAPEGGA